MNKLLIGYKFQDYCVDVIKYFTPEFCEAHEEWCIEDYGQFERWAGYLYIKEYAPSRAGRIIERAYNLYIKNDGKNNS